MGSWDYNGLLSGAGSGPLLLLGKASLLRTRKAAPAVAAAPKPGAQPGSASGSPRNSRLQAAGCRRELVGSDGFSWLDLEEASLWGGNQR